MANGKAIRIHEHGGPEVLKLEDAEFRDPGAGEIRIRQTAIGLNFIDTYIRTGLYPSKLPTIPGFEGAGVVDAVGEGVEGLKAGDRVAYPTMPGAYATHVVGAADRAVKIPDGVSDEDSAAMMMKGMTAWMLLFEIKLVMPGDKVLIWAAAGGVGSVLVPWAKALGAEVIGVVSTQEKAERVLKNGADAVVLSSADVAAEVRELTGGKGVDVSLDGVGKDSAEASLKSLRSRGLFVTYGNASGPVDPVPPARLNQLGSLMMTRPGLFHFISTREDLIRAAQAVFGAMRVGAIKADIGQTYDLADAAQAHIDLEGRKTVGSTILKP